MQALGSGTIESPWAPSTMASTSTTDVPVSSAMNHEKRAESSTPAMPITRRAGKPSLTRASETIESSGFVTTITIASGDPSRMYSATEAITLPLVSSRSERLIPGLRGSPAVTMKRSEPCVARGSLGPDDARAEALDRAHLVQVERDALGAPLDDVDQADLAGQFLLGAELGAGHADVAGADDGDLALRDRHGAG